jgi:hypothetical protein
MVMAGTVHRHGGPAALNFRPLSQTGTPLATGVTIRSECCVISGCWVVTRTHRARPPDQRAVEYQTPGVAYPNVRFAPQKRSFKLRAELLADVLPARGQLR